MEKFVQLTLLSNSIVMGMITTGEKLEILIFREIFHRNYNQILESEGLNFHSAAYNMILSRLFNFCPSISSVEIILPPISAIEMK